jgi:tryptophan halogenase
VSAEAELIRHVAGLGAPFGLERSVKITPGAVHAERRLMSVHLSSLGPDPLARVAAIGAAFALPRQIDLAPALAGADIVHFGYERGAEGDVFKLYFEYAKRTRAAIAAGKPVLVHRAIKWERARPDRHAWTRYAWPGCRGRPAVEATLARLAAAGSRAHAHTLALLARAKDADTLLLEVDEAENPRRSWDVNIYDAELKLGDALDLVMAAVRDFGCGPQAEAAFAPRREAVLGHVSGGMGRDGREFLTFYFGVEARRGR